MLGTLLFDFEVLLCRIIHRDWPFQGVYFLYNSSLKERKAMSYVFEVVDYDYDAKNAFCQLSTIKSTQFNKHALYLSNS